MAKRAQQEMVFRTRGGKRRGAGRPPKGRRSSEPHKWRPEHVARNPVHVTIRVAEDVAGLRTKRMFAAFREATYVTAKREDFHIVHMSVQANHVHLIVEADHKSALARGMQGFEISAARHINAAMGRRGAVFPDHYHARPLTTPRAVRHAICYVLNNWRRHREDRAAHTKPWKIDPFSSGTAFAGWQELAGSPVMFKQPEAYRALFVWRPRTWLLATGWAAHHRLISTHEVPGPAS
ncbi:MAG: transposase [Kofleriaceae bacterium]